MNELLSAATMAASTVEQDKVAAARAATVKAEERNARVQSRLRYFNETLRDRLISALDKEKLVIARANVSTQDNGEKTHVELYCTALRGSPYTALAFRGYNSRGESQNRSRLFARSIKLTQHMQQALDFAGADAWCYEHRSNETNDFAARITLSIGD